MIDLSKFTVNCSMIFTELPLLERPKAAADAGFASVEFWWPFAAAAPTSGEVDRFVQALADAEVALTGLNLFAGDMAAGERGILSSPERGTEFAENLEVVTDLAVRTGCRIFNALYGNRLPGFSAEEQDQVALERLTALSPFTASMGAEVVLEPLSGVDAYPLVTARQAIDVIENLRQSGATTVVKLLADLYHLAANGDDVSKVIATWAPLIGHVQIADSPGRGEPGTGALPIRRWFDELKASGYSGLIGLEYRPTAASAESFGWIETLYD
jgi:hydroxypyruvate isomerase